MIIADTNSIAYLYLPSAYSEACEQALAKDSHWAAPMLWRSELRNILALYIRKALLTLADALEIQRQAENLLKDNEFEVDSLGVLRLANESGCSAYDCEFVYLAQTTQSPLITADNKLLRSFPNTAITAQDFITRPGQ